MIFYKYPIYIQLDKMDCGPTCLKMISKYYGKDIPIQYIREYSYITNRGVSLLGIKEASKKIGFNSFSILLNLKELKEVIHHLPVIIHWNSSHFVVLYKIKFNKFKNKYFYTIGDPARGLINVEEKYFIKSWCRDNQGIVLFLKPEKEFFSKNYISNKNNPIIFRIRKLVLSHSSEFIQLFLSLLFVSILSLFFPFFMQFLIDKGIKNENTNIVFIILLSQLFVFLGISLV